MAAGKPVAAILSALTVAFSAGIAPYEALAQTLGQSAGTSVGNGAGAAAGSVSPVSVTPQLPNSLIATPGSAGLGQAQAGPAPIQGPAASAEAGATASGPRSSPALVASPLLSSPAAATAPAATPGRVTTVASPAAAPAAKAAPAAETAAPVARTQAKAAAHTAAAVTKVSAGVRSLGRTISGAVTGRGLGSNLNLVFENNGRAAEEPSVEAGGAASPAANGLKPAGKAPAAAPSATPAPKPASPAKSFARDFSTVFVEPLWTPLTGAVRSGSAALTYPIRHPVRTARGFAAGLAAAGRAALHPVRTLRAARIKVPAWVKARVAQATGGAASSLSEFNKSEKAYLTGQAVFLFAISVYLASLPLLVTALTGQPELTGVARAVHYWSFGIASLFSGRVVRSTPMRLILGGGAAVRAAAFLTIGMLAFANLLSWQVFLVLIGANALIVAMNHLVDIDTNGAKKVFGSDEKIEKAGYVYDLIYYGMMLVVPPVLGLGMDWIDSRFGPGAGAFSGFTLFAAVMGVVSWIYATKVRIIGEAVQRWALELTSGPARRWGIGLASAGVAIAGAAWFALGAAVLASPLGLAALGLGALAAVSGVVALFHWETLVTIYRNKAVFARWTMATAENFVEDALFAVVLPTFALQVLGVAAFGNGLILSAITLGGLVASKLLVSRAKDHQKRMGTYRFLTVLTAGASLAFIPSIGLWAAPSLAIAIPLVFLMKYLYQPIRSRMRALLQVSIKNDPEADKRSEDIYGLMSVVEVLAAGAGGLAFAWLFGHSAPGTVLHSVFGPDAAMKAVTAVLAGMSLVYLAGLSWIKGQLAKQVEYRIRSSDADPAKAAEIEAAAYAKLEANLAKMGLKPYLTKTVQGPVDEDRPTVAILAPASTHKLAMALEGGRQSAGDVHLALDPSWIIQEVHPGERNTLLLKKGLTFTEDGQAIVVEYKVPRKVRYWGNWYTLGANDRADGVPLEENADVPQSSSLALEAITNDKLRTRLMMAARGVAVPATLALLMPQHPLAGSQAGMVAPSVFVEKLAPAAERSAQVEGAVNEYLDSFPGREVVVKPSGPQFHSGRGVKFFPASERAKIIEHALALAEDPMMTEDGVVLVDERVPSLEISRDRKLETTLRVLVARAPWNEGVTTGIFARVGPWGKPTTAEAADPRDNATVESWQALLDQWVESGQLTRERANDLDEQVRRLGPGAFESIAENEGLRERGPGEPYQAQTDLIGLDVMIGRYGDRVKPVIIEVNDHDSGGQYNLEFALKEGHEHSAALVATWLARARRDALKGKRIVLVGAGYPGNSGYLGKKLFFDRARELGVQVVLIDKPGSWAKDLVAEYIAVDTTKPEEALAKAKKKLLRSARKNGKLDGITTFWEDDVMLTSRLGKELGLAYHSEDAAETARNKFALRAAMEKAGLPSPSYALVKSRRGLEELFAERRRAGNPFPFPAVLKPARGAAAQGTKKAETEAEALRMFDEIYADMDPAKDSIFKQGREVILDEYLDGHEGDVDIVWEDGKAPYAAETDNWPTKEPYFLATGSSSPGRLLTEEQKEEVLELSAKTLKAIGFSNGVFHVEFKYTSKGPRLIEVNARPGGVYVVPWNQQVWGVDLAEMLFATAAGVPAVPYTPSKPRTHLEGEFLIPGASGKLERFDMDPGGSAEGFHELLTLKLVGADVQVPPDGYDRVGMLVANGKTAEEAQANLDAQRARLRLEIKPK